ncbi:MAG: hypothetical protein DRO63_08510 [Candidatus Gerdarchaeota archaeon]|nr:MAG: hypothetical protein DRO63_08510 [Candidatus Gerdarchaeota archaeon]
MTSHRIKYLVRQNAKVQLSIKNIEGFYIRKVTPFGTSAKVDCPKAHLGKTVYLVVVQND